MLVPNYSSYRVFGIWLVNLISHREAFLLKAGLCLVKIRLLATELWHVEFLGKYEEIKGIERL